MEILDFILHIDDQLRQLVADYGTLTYIILFLIIFIETGLVVWPFLPGDSLLFAAGALAASGSLNLYTLLILLFVAAVLGDTVNYTIGNKLGLKLLSKKIKGKPIVKPAYIDKTKEFFEKHGPKTIILARFVPIVRTFAPFVAGIGTMHYRTFISYNIVGGFVWVVTLTLAGYWFGTIPFVAQNFELVVLGIIGISLIPMIVEILRQYFANKKEVKS